MKGNIFSCVILDNAGIDEMLQDQEPLFAMPKAQQTTLCLNNAMKR
jgi:hypothetical protein